MSLIKWPRASLAVVGGAAILGVRVNTTPSLPRGLYVAA